MPRTHKQTWESAILTMLAGLVERFTDARFMLPIPIF
jgi:hypothetical protein